LAAQLADRTEIVGDWEKSLARMKKKISEGMQQIAC